MLILFGIGAAPAVSLAVVRSMHIDFGINTQPTSLPGWNNFTGQALTEPTTVLNLIDSTDVPTGIVFTPTWSAVDSDSDTGIALAQSNFQGRYPDELPGIAQSALRDNLYVRDGYTFTITLSSLPANTRYNFLFYGAAGTTGDYSLWTVTGSNSGSDFITPLVANHTQVATVNGIIPNASNSISVRFEGRRTDGTMQSPAVNNDGLGRFNYMRILQHSLIPGDFDANGVVNAADYTAWRNDFGNWAHVSGADGNHNGFVDAADYVVWRKAMSTAGGAGLTSNPQSQSVPEPHAAVLLAATILSVSGLRMWALRRSPR